MTAAPPTDATRRPVLLSCLLVIALFAATGNTTPASTIVRFDTSLGDIDVRLFDAATPASVANFLNYVTDGDYNSSFFHRAPRTLRVNSAGELVDANGVPLPLDNMGDPIDADNDGFPDNAVVDTFVVQGGGFTFNGVTGLGNVPRDAPVQNEPVFTNLPGTIAYAKVGPDFDNQGNLIPGTGPDSATNGFFFNTSNNVANLDNQNGGFTVFARVVRGQAVLDAITGLVVTDLDPPADPTPGNPFPFNPPTFDNVPVIIPTPDNPGLVDNLVFVNNVTTLSLPDGDYDFDGDVDVDDYEVWRSQFGNSLRISDHVGASPDTLLDADGNGDGVVDVADFTIWRDGLGVASRAAVVAVPEPAALLLALLVAGAGWGVSRR